MTETQKRRREILVTMHELRAKLRSLRAYHSVYLEEVEDLKKPLRRQTVTPQEAHVLRDRIKEQENNAVEVRGKILYASLRMLALHLELAMYPARKSRSRRRTGDKKRNQ